MLLQSSILPSVYNVRNLFCWETKTDYFQGLNLDVVGKRQTLIFPFYHVKPTFSWPYQTLHANWTHQLLQCSTTQLASTFMLDDHAPHFFLIKIQRNILTVYNGALAFNFLHHHSHLSIFFFFLSFWMNSHPSRYHNNSPGFIHFISSGGTHAWSHHPFSLPYFNSSPKPWSTHLS